VRERVSLTRVVLVLLAGLVPYVNVAGTTTCPEPAEVGRHLERLLPPAEPGVEPDRAHLEAKDGELHVRLETREGTLIAERSFSLDHPCEDLARAAAITIAVWERDARQAPPAQPPAQPPTPPPAPPPPDRRPEKAAPTPRVRPQPAAAGPRIALETGAGAGLHVADSATAGFLLTSTFLFPRVGAHLFALAGLPRDIAIDVSRAGWWRSAAGLGLAVDALGQAPVTLRAHVDAVVGIVRVEGGEGLQPAVSWGAEPGVSGGLALGLRGRWSPVLSADLVVWPREQRAFVSDHSVYRGLPGMDLLFGAGFAIRWLEPAGRAGHGDR